MTLQRSTSYEPITPCECFESPCKCELVAHMDRLMAYRSARMRRYVVQLQWAVKPSTWRALWMLLRFTWAQRKAQAFVESTTGLRPGHVIEFGDGTRRTIISVDNAHTVTIKRSPLADWWRLVCSHFDPFGELRWLVRRAVRFVAGAAVTVFLVTQLVWMAWLWTHGTATRTDDVEVAPMGAP